MSETKPLYSTVQLCQLNDKNLPVKIASGCLIRIGERKLLLSVEHATGNDERWAILMEYDKVKGAGHYVVGSMNFIMRMDISMVDQETLDFSYVEISEDIVPSRHIVDIHGDTVSQQDILVFDAPFHTLPEVGESCTFEGAVKPSTYQNLFNKDRPVFDTELLTYQDFTYLRREGDFHVFQLPFKHPGHDWFKGCSGAPILNSSGHPIGLIAKGDLDTDEIFATALDALIPVIQATID